VNHYVSLTIMDDRADVVVSLLHGDLPGAERRRAMDADGNGTVDDQELETERRAWSRRAAELVRVTVDGQSAALDTIAAIDLAGEPRVTARPLVVELAAHLALTPARHTLTIEPRGYGPRDGETEVTLDLGPGWNLLTGRLAQEQAGRPPQRRFAFAGPRSSVREDRCVTFVIEPGAQQPPAAKGGAQRAAIGLAIVLGLIGLGGLAIYRGSRR
jgi:hypothetical protein